MYKIARSNIYFILLLALLLQITALDHLRIFGAKPDLVLIAVIFFGFFLGQGAGLETGIVSGAACDMLGLDFFGMNMFVFAIIGLLAGAISTKVFKESARTQGSVVLFLTAVAAILHFVLVQMFSASLSLGFAEYLVGSVLPVSIYTSLVSIPIFLRLINIYDLRGAEEYL